MTNGRGYFRWVDDEIAGYVCECVRTKGLAIGINIDYPVQCEGCGVWYKLRQTNEAIVCDKFGREIQDDDAQA